MKRIIFDFILRWRWVIACYLVFLSLLTWVFPFSFAPLFMQLLMTERNQGILRTLRPQPVTKRDQERAWWFISVGLTSLLSLPIMVTTTALHPWVMQHIRHVSVPAPWFSLAVVLWFGVGLSALIFLLPTQPQPTYLGKLLAIPGRMLWALATPLCVFVATRLPRTPEAMQPWQWMLAALVPVLLGISYWAAPRVLDPVSSPTLTRSFQEETSPQTDTGPQGLSLFLLTVHGRLIAISVALMVGIISLAQLKEGLSKTMPPSYASMMLGLAMFLPTGLFEAVNLRMLRILPLRSSQLTALLLSLPLLQGVIMGPLLVWSLGLSSGHLPLWQDVLCAVLYIAGGGAAMLTLAFHVSSGWRVYLYTLPMVLMIPLSHLSAFPLHEWQCIFGSLALILSAMATQRGLWRSAAFYRPRLRLNGQDESALNNT
ncbi:hypothetical protein [Prosthecobacter dejongeii]|uniref:Uncharacterized protein n=1 Tax=Prosthecobacter dejongeii TaxID=48465 RepID=A0A7W8DQK4_9BACT|nr:hypothetical protein [Prosthecobacter dejongeii]MBB5038583.1 hypothetical protein [Prosthecobacter dejongeii]